MSTVNAKILTAEEFARLPQPPDGSKQELVQGVVVTMPPPSFYHGLVCSEFNFRLRQHVSPAGLGFVTCNDSGAVLFRDPDTVRGPDVAFWSKQRLPAPPKGTYPAVVPDLVVEVLSPDEAFRSLFAKVDEYLRAGVRLVWVAIPEDRAVGVFARGQGQQLLSEADTLTAGDMLPGFSCRVGEFFP